MLGNVNDLRGREREREGGREGEREREFYLMRIPEP